MKLNWLHITFLSVFLCAFEIKAAPNDYDGVWTANVSCSAIRANAQYPAYTYDENWQIQNGVIKFKSVREGRQGSSETNWIGNMENGAAKLTGNAFRVNNPNETWNLNLSGAAANEGLINLSGGMFNKNGLIRDCTVTLKSYEPSNSSLAYIKSQPKTIANNKIVASSEPPDKQPKKPIKETDTTKTIDKKDVSIEDVKTAQTKINKEQNFPTRDAQDASEKFIGNSLIFFLMGVLMAGIISFITFRRKNAKSDKGSSISKKISALENTISSLSANVLEADNLRAKLTSQIAELEKKIVNINNEHLRSVEEKDREISTLKNDVVGYSKLRENIVILEKNLADLANSHLIELQDKNKQLLSAQNEVFTLNKMLKEAEENLQNVSFVQEAPHKSTFCTGCGEKIRDGAKFCIGCGKVV